MLNKNISKSSKMHPIHEKIMPKAYKLFFGTLTSQNRLRIINLLREGSKNVSEIQNTLRLRQTSVSHDLQRLKKCGFVSVEKKGKYRYYNLNKQTISSLMNIIDKHMEKFCMRIVSHQKGGRK